MEHPLTSRQVLQRIGRSKKDMVVFLFNSVIYVSLLLYLCILIVSLGYVLLWLGDRGDTVVKVLCYKSECRWFDFRWCHWNFSLT